MKLPDELTIGQAYGPAMDITDQAAADEYLEALVARCMRVAIDRRYRYRAAAEKLERSNLGYFAGYCGAETMERVNRLFRTTHPIFGDKRPTAREALLAGMVAATSGPEAAAQAFAVYADDGEERP